MVSSDIITKIIEAGAAAPSGGNSQPWKFEVRGSKITVIALPLKDHAVLNFRYRGTWIAHGALIENMVIAASALGYRAAVSIFPVATNHNITAEITLEKADILADSLATAVLLRGTNRKPFAKAPLTIEEKSALEKAQKEIGGEVLFLEKPEELEVLGRASSNNEIVMLENRLLHDLFFAEVVWSQEEERKKGGGLYLKTLELKAPQEFMIKLCKSWWVMNLLNKVGMAKLIAKDGAKIYSSAGAMGAIVVRDESDEAFVSAGRLMERIWLTATNLGLSLQLMTGVLFFFQKIYGLLGGKSRFERGDNSLLKRMED